MLISSITKTFICTWRELLFFFFFRYRASRDTCTHIDEIILKSYRVHTTVWISDRTNNTIRCQTKHLSFFFSGFFSQRTDWRLLIIWSRKKILWRNNIIIRSNLSNIIITILGLICNAEEHYRTSIKKKRK